ncbi:ras and Rab interactor 2 [Hoplias malabaricus]|uniref:ras and Rab interactor 2 n=1 Tax=Hoplias malabaricus TaxID=27720 RepID=UPI0034627782
MQEDPVYDYPDPQPVGERRACTQRGSLKSISVLDRLLLTYPVWLQLSVNSATGLHILHREPPGTFLVRKSSTSQKKMLCVRLADDSMPSFVKQFVIREKDSTFSLESSAISFPDLCRLIAFYCVSRDVLPFTLELPEAIAKASSHKQLESISHMGVEFWSSQLNFRGPRNSPAQVPDAPQNTDPGPNTFPIPPQNPTPKDSGPFTSKSSTLFQEFCPIQTRSPSELDLGAGQGALCFINPLFLQEYPVCGAMHKRHHFKRSFKVRVSTENTSSLSPPISPPPPPPLLAKAKSKGASVPQTEVVHTSDEAKEKTEDVEGDSDYRQPCPTLPKKGSAMVIPTLSPTAEEDDYQLPKALSKASTKKEGEEEGEDEGVGLVLEQRSAPSLSELDSSSSLSSLDERDESPERPSLTRGISNPIIASPRPPRQSVSALRKMSAAFVSFFVPGKRVARLVEDLSRDRRMAFGTLVQDFLREQREALKPQSLKSAVDLLQRLRSFINQAKVFLVECGELEPPIETLVPEDEKDQTLEKALFRCILKPLKTQIYTALQILHERDGSSKRMTESMRRAKENSPRDLFGVQVAVPDAQGIEKIKRKLSLMKRAYSPIDKVHLLLQTCKLIYKAMKSNTAQEFGADDFLPALSYVIVNCDMPELFLEVEYMMELLETPWLTGEGGYYLTSVYASLSHIQSEPEAVAKSGLTQQVRESLKEWSRRRNSSEAKSQKDTNLHHRFVKVLFQDGECSLVKTLQWKAGVSGEALAQLCGVKFGVEQPEDYGLYWRRDGELMPLPSDAQIQDLLSLGSRSPPLIYQLSNQDMKSRKLTRGGALDLSADAS